MYQYHVKWFCNNEFIDTYGLVSANNYSEAVKLLIEHFDDNNIQTLCLEILNDTPGILEYNEGTEDLKGFFMDD